MAKDLAHFINYMWGCVCVFLLLTWKRFHLKCHLWHWTLPTDLLISKLRNFKKNSKIVKETNLNGRDYEE